MSTINVLSKFIETVISNISNEIFIFTAEQVLCILHRQVFVMSATPKGRTLHDGAERSWVRSPQAAPWRVLEQDTLLPTVLVNPRPDMTEKMLTGALSFNTNK